MNDFLTELKKLGIEIAYLVAGIAGAFVSMHKTDKTISLGELTRHIISGGVTAMYLTPVVNEVIRLNTSGLLFSAFVTGFMGYKAVDLAVSYLRRRFSKK
jgi:hypothetical protein